MSDISDSAIYWAKHNTRKNQLNEIRIILGGRMIMVTKRKERYKNKFISIFGGVTIFEVDGYYVFIAEKRNLLNTKKADKNNDKLPKKLMRKHVRITGKR